MKTKDGYKLSRKDIYYSINIVNGISVVATNFIKFLKHIDYSNAYYHFTNARDEAHRLNKLQNRVRVFNPPYTGEKVA